MPIPDWVARETRYLHERAFHVLAAMFMEGTREVLEDGAELLVLREEWPEEVGMMDRFETRRVWKQLAARGLVAYRREDHMAVSGRLRGSYVCQDRIVQFSYVRNKVEENCTNGTQVSIREIAGTEWPKGSIESEPADPSRAYARDNNMRTRAGGDSTATPTTPTPTTASAAATAPVAMPSLEEALQLIGFSEDGQADELIRGFGFNSTAVAVRYLVRGLRGAARGKQPPISSKTGYVIQYLGANRKVQFAEVEDFGFLVDLVRLLRGPCPDGRVIEFPARGEA